MPQTISKLGPASNFSSAAGSTTELGYIVEARLLRGTPRVEGLEVLKMHCTGLRVGWRRLGNELGAVHSEISDMHASFLLAGLFFFGLVSATAPLEPEEFFLGVEGIVAEGPKFSPQSSW